MGLYMKYDIMTFRFMSLTPCCGSLIHNICITDFNSSYRCEECTTFLYMGCCAQSHYPKTVMMIFLIKQIHIVIFNICLISSSQDPYCTNTLMMIFWGLEHHKKTVPRPGFEPMMSMVQAGALTHSAIMTTC